MWGHIRVVFWAVAFDDRVIISLKMSQKYEKVIRVRIQDSRPLFVTYTYRICSEIKSGDAQRNVQKNTKDNLNWKVSESVYL